MSDLISRSEAIKLLRKNMSNDIQDQIITENNINLIESLPTAFDTEKVVEQIHDKYCHKCRNILGKQSSEEYCKSVKCEIDALCDIVKKGGVE